MIVGVDVNLRRVTACYLGLPDSPIVFRSWLIPDKTPSLECPRLIYTEIKKVPLLHGPSIWIERPMGAHVRSVADLSRVMGAVICAIPAYVAVSEITPSEWKKACGLPGNAGKLDVQLWANVIAAWDSGSKAPVRSLNEHEADALGVAWACKSLSERAIGYEAPLSYTEIGD